MLCSTGKHPNQLATLTAHATQLQTRLLVALDTLDSQNLAHASEIATLQESHDKLAARARRLEYERNAANDDLAEMASVLIEKVSAANDYKVLAHSDLHLPLPLSPPRTRPGAPGSRRAKHESPTDSSAYTAALVAALTTQLDVIRSQASKDRADAERKISRLETMVELRDVELKRNLSRSINSEAVDSGTESSGSSRMSRGEAIAAYETVAKENERLGKEVARLKAELAAAEFNRATSEIRTSSSWAQLPDWARPQPVASTSKPKRSPRPLVHSESSDRAPSSMSEPQASPRLLPVLQREDSSASDPTPQRPGPSQPRARSSASTSDYRARSRASRPTVTVSDSNSDDSRITLPQPATKLKRSNLRDSGIGVDSGSEATTSNVKPKSGTKDRRSVESPRPKPDQEQEARGQDLMPLLPALTPSKVRAPRVEMVDLPSTSYIEPSFGVSLRKKGERQRPESRETSRTTIPDLLSPGLIEPALGPTLSPQALSPVGEFLLPPSVISREPPMAPVVPVELVPVLQPPVILQPAPVLHPTLPQSRDRSRSNSRTARHSPLPPVFDLTGLPAYESLTSVPSSKSSPIPQMKSPQNLAVPIDSPIRRQSDPAPNTQTEPPLVRPRSSSVAPSTPPRSTNNTAQFAFITPIHESVEAPSMEAAAAISTAVQAGTTLGINSTNTTFADSAPNTSKATAGGRKLLPMFKFISPVPATPPSMKKRRMTAPSQLSNSTGLGASPKHGIASSPLVRGKPVRESPLQLVMGSVHAARRAEMRVPVMREVGAASGTVTGTGFVPPIVPSVPLNALVAQLVPPPVQLPKLEFPPGTSPETQTVLRGMQAERALLDQAQPSQEDVTPEQMAHVLLIEAECIRLRRDSAEAAALRHEVEILRARLREQEHEQGGMSDDTATEATIPEAGDTARRRMEYVERDLRTTYPVYFDAESRVLLSSTTLTCDMPVVSEVPLSSLMNAVLIPIPPKNLKSTFKALRKGNHIQCPEGHDPRWTCLPQDPCDSEQPADQTFKSVEEITKAIQESHAPESQERVALDVTGQVAPVSFRQSTLRPDGFIHFKRPPSTPVEWADIILTMEFSNECTERKNTHASLISSMQHIMRTDARRRCVYGLTCENTTARLWYGDRSDFVVSTAFDVNEDWKRLVRIILSILLASPAQLGFDPTMMACPPTNGNSEPRYFITVHNSDTKAVTQYQTVRMLSEVGADSLVGGGTRVWMVQKVVDGVPVGPFYALKDVWVCENRDPEHQLLLQIRNEQPQYSQHFLTPLDYGYVPHDLSEPSSLDNTYKTLRRGKFKFEPTRWTLHIHSVSMLCTTSTSEDSVDRPEDIYNSPWKVDHSHSHLSKDARQHYRLIVEEIGEPVHDLRNFTDVFTAIQGGWEGLHAIHISGRVHRDVSGGNILLVPASGNLGQRGVIMDLEYVKEIDDMSTPHDERTGTTEFMATEVDYTEHHRLSTVRSHLELLNTPLEDPEHEEQELTEQKKTLDLNSASNSQPPFRYNPLHDMESIWWLCIWMMFRLVPSNVQLWHYIDNYQKVFFNPLIKEHFVCYPGSFLKHTTHLSWVNPFIESMLEWQQQLDALYYHSYKAQNALSVPLKRIQIGEKTLHTVRVYDSGKVALEDLKTASMDISVDLMTLSERYRMLQQNVSPTTASSKPKLVFDGVHIPPLKRRCVTLCQ
ncbi:kinase domain protein [Rhizoctonia solani 123E]|uniref:Kinase domain protein n=1 Tax=Rhizoctonia solani 123E TaxID=1423351 RepID=A0A074RT63_9AGAM|nr:kinase domain protein [Rhizoctonia solani 123E]